MRPIDEGYLDKIQSLGALVNCASDVRFIEESEILILWISDNLKPEAIAEIAVLASLIWQSDTTTYRLNPAAGGMELVTEP